MNTNKEEILRLKSKLSPTKQALLEKRLRGEVKLDSKSNIISRRSSTAPQPLSFAQQRLWFLQQLEPDNPFYNEHFATQLTGSLEVAAFGQSLNQMVQRHEALRTTFKMLDEQPVQIIAPSLILTLPVINLCDLSETEQKTEVHRLATEQNQRPFDLTQVPLMRCTLLQLGEQKHVLLLTMHHIICDGWSMGVIVRELSALYQAFSTGKPTSLPDLPIQYADFAVWQRQELQGAELESQLSYWKQQLENAPPLLQLPTDRPRPAVQTYQGAKQSFLLPKSLTEALKEIAQKAESTLFMTLLAAFKILLYRYTGQEDIIVGSPIANRNRAEIEGLIGFFVNTLVLRTNISGNPTFEKLLGRVLQVTMGAYEHQDLPFEKLLEELQLQRNVNYNPLFQVLFTLQNTPKVKIELPGLTLTPFDVEYTRALFDLRLDITETDLGLEGFWEYNTDLFDAATIIRISEHFQTLLEAIAANPKQQVDQLPLLSEAEQHQLLNEWNQTQADYPKDACIHQLFEAQVEKTPDAVAVVFENQQLTYHQLNQRANQLAHHLQSLGVQPEVLVGICVERSLEMLIGLLGILKAGGAYVPIDPTYPQERLALILSDSQTSLLLTQQHLQEKLPPHPTPVLCLDTDWETISSKNSLNSTTPENLAYVIYTSGSTGKPKGVQIPHRALVNFLQSMAREPGLNPSDTLLAVTSISFDIAALELYLPLITGARLELASREVATDPKQLMEQLKASGATVMQATPATWRMLLTANWQGNPNLKILCGGEALPQDLAGELLNKGATLWNLYGPTETTIWSTAYRVEATQLSRAIVPIGRPIANTKIYLLDSGGQPVPVGIPGELHIGGAGLARGYLNRPELTAEKFIINAAGERLYKSGDLARYLPDGKIEYIERVDHQVKIRGFRIELGEIEAVVSQHPAVVQAVVIARDDEPGNKHLVAYVVTSEQSLIINQLREFLKYKLPEYMVPSAFVTLDTLPLTPNGKVDRKALPAIDGKISRENEYVPPRTPSEEIIANIFASVLGVQNVGIHDNFFALGGHSLLATQLISRLKVALDVEIPLRTIFESPTVVQFEQTLTQLRTTNSQLTLPPIQPRTDSEQLPLSWAQERLWFLNQLEGSSATYNIPAAVRITGNLDIKALQQALSEIVSRHEILRTSFSTVNGKPVQIIDPEVTMNIKVVDLRQLEVTERETVLKQQAQLEATTPFELEVAPLIRCSLLHLNATEYVLLLTMHHIVSDGWSMGVFIEEASGLYQAFVAGEPSPLAELPIQYADFAVWQRQWLSGEVLQNQLNYWQQQLQGAPELLQLPTDRPRPSVQTFQGRTESFSLNANLTQKLQNLSGELGTTLFMTLLGAFATLLYRYTGQEDIVIGSPIANRNRGEIESLIGFFVNTLVLRTHFEENPSFQNLLAQVRETTLQAYEHQDVPFEQVVEALQPQRSLSYSPLFQVMFILQNAAMGEVELPGVTLTQLAPQSTIAKFDLTLSITETSQGLLGEWEYNTDLFDGSTIERMAVHFQNLLSAIVENPQLCVAELPLLSEAEQHQLLNEWNHTETGYPTNKCIHQLFEEQVERTPDEIALIFENQQLTYRQLNQRANQLAHYLGSLGVGSGVLVGISFEPSLELVVSLLGVLKADGVYVPLDPNYPQERLAFMLEDSNVHVLLTQEPLLERISPQQAHIVCLDRDKDAIDRESIENPDHQTTLDDLAYAIYTSGSTGRPKAVLGKIRGIVNRLHWMWETLPFGADEICSQKTSINFVDHVAEIFSPLLKGIPLVIVPDNIRGDIPRLMSLLSDKKITRIVLVPSLLKAILDNPPQQIQQLQYLKYVFCSGEALPLTLAEAFHQKLSSARLFNVYGSSEVAADVTCFEVNFWETRQRILQYFKPEVVHDTTENQVLGMHQKPFTKPGVSPEILAEKFQRSELPSYPFTVDDYYEKLFQEVLPYVIDTGSPTFIGHMTSALPDFMHDMSKMISRLNQNLVKIETSKSLIFLEREAIAILHRLVYGFADDFYEENIQQKNRNLGIITTGGTTANISALLCARNWGLLSQENSGELSTESLYKVLSKKGYHDIVIIGSRLMHYSVNKAASMLGLGTDNIIFIDSNDEGELDLNLLKEKICECRRNKLYILALVGIAGTTETGEIDPLFELGDIAQKFSIHFHVDAAWGGATIFSEKHKGKLKGINKADSITICGHKQLYLPQGISVCLFKDPQMLNFAETTARYQAQRDTFDVGRFTIEGSRSALSLCLHAALHIIGKRGYEILIDNSIGKAQYFSRLIQLLEPFELIIEPELNIVNYRYIPEDLRAKAQQKSLTNDDIKRINQLNAQVQKEQFEQGLTFVSKTTLIDNIYGKNQEIVVFRTVLSNPNTTTADLHSVLEDQLKIANQIEAKSQDKLDTQQNLLIKSISLGDTETAILQKETIHLQLADVSKADLGEALEEYLKKNTIPIGRPIANTQVYILDKYGNLLPPGVTGELYVGGDGLAQGYLNLPELTQEKFILNPFTKDKGKRKKTEERLYRTGDLVRWLPDGNIEFVGRIDHQVKIRGFRIELGEIDAVLNTHPKIQQTVVIAREDIPGDKRIVAYILTSDQSLTIKQLREFLEQKLPAYMVPSTFITLDTLPLTPNGKVDRKALPAPDGNFSREHEYVAPSTPSEKIIANIFASVLGVQNVGIHDNFFELGGHSLLIIKLRSELSQQLKIDLPVLDFFRYPTISSLVEYLTLFKDQLSSVTTTEIETKKILAGKAQQRQRRQKMKSIKNIKI